MVYYPRDQLQFIIISQLYSYSLCCQSVVLCIVCSPPSYMGCTASDPALFLLVAMK